MTAATQRAEVIVIGGGQAGLAAGYHLSRAGIPFLAGPPGSGRNLRPGGKRPPLSP